MQAPVFKSLAKPVYWCGVPRMAFFAIIIMSGIMFLFFKTIYIVIPVTFLFFLLRLLVREDRRIFAVIQESIRTKGHYFPD